MQFLNNEYTGENFRTNFCSIHRNVEYGYVALENALKGKNITIAITQPINNKLPSLQIRILDEVAKRAGFNYIAYVTSPPKSNETWTQILLRDANNYDLVVDRWVRLLRRLAEGVVYPEAWYDADYILVSKQAQPNDAFVIWSFSKPFSPLLWVSTVSAIVITGLVFYFLDFLQAQAQRDSMFSTIEGCIFASAYSYTGTRSILSPKSRSSMILIISTAFLYLILVSTYTANLTNYYHLKSQPQVVANDLSDVAKKNLVLCVEKGFSKEEILEKQNVNPKVYEVLNDSTILEALSEDKCDVGLLAKGSFSMFKEDTEFNKDCNIEWIGRRVMSTQAGFALADSQERCSSLLDNVLDYHLLQMKRENEIAEILERFRKQNYANTCRVKAKSEETQLKSIKILNVGGVFLLHICLIVLSILLELYHHYTLPKEVKEKLAKEAKNSLNESISSLGFLYLGSSHGGKTAEKSFSYPRDEELHMVHRDVILSESKRLSIKTTSDEESLIMKFYEEIMEQNNDLQTSLDKERKEVEAVTYELGGLREIVKHLLNETLKGRDSYS